MASIRQCSRCGKKRQLRFFKEAGRICLPCQKQGTARTSKARRLQETYGISHEEYDELLAAQGGTCAICGRTPRYNLDVDHDHRTGLIRGLLCKMCNRHLLPSVRDDPDVLDAAAHYLIQAAIEPPFGGRKVPNV